MPPLSSREVEGRGGVPANSREAEGRGDCRSHCCEGDGAGWGECMAMMMVVAENKADLVSLSIRLACLF